MKQENAKRIKEIIKKHNKMAKSKNIFARPASGMVGQDCEGYIPDESGGVIKVQRERSGMEYIGPGTYSPKIMKNKPHFTKMSPNCLRTNFIHTYSRSGPSDNTTTPNSTKISHMFKPTDPYPVGETPKSGELSHQPWYPEESQSEISTSMFKSSIERELWPPSPFTPSPVAHCPGVVNIVEYNENTQSSAFLSHSERFKDIFKVSDTPSPTTYTLPEEIGKAPTAVIYPREIPSKFGNYAKLYGKKHLKEKPKFKTEDERDIFSPIKSRNSLITPSPFDYAPESIISRPNTSNKFPNFDTRRERFISESEKSPGPAFYDNNKSSFSNELDSNSMRKNHRIRSRLDSKRETWDYLPSRETPNMKGNPEAKMPKPKGGYISTIGHQPLQNSSDHPLAFRTLHSDFIKKSFNARYLNL